MPTRKEELNEYFQTLSHYEAILKQKKNTVSRFPDNKKIVLLFSGGLDSVVTAAKLIEEQDLEIFPLFFNRGQQNLAQEQRSVDYFTAFLQNKYGPEKFHSPKILNIAIPAQELKAALRNRDTVQGKGYPLRNTIMMHYAVQYAVSISTEDSPIRTIFTGDLAGATFAHSTIAAFRSVTLSVCQSMKDWSWNITAPHIDDYLTKTPQNKSDLVNWAHLHEIPIDQSFSCYTPLDKNAAQACGYCLACLLRKQAYKNNEWRSLKPILIGGEIVASLPDAIYINLDETLVHTTAQPLSQRSAILDAIQKDSLKNAVFSRENGGAFLTSIFRSDVDQLFDRLREFQTEKKRVILYSLADDTHVAPLVEFIVSTFGFSFDGIISSDCLQTLSKKDVSPRSVLLDDMSFNDQTHQVERFKWGLIDGKIFMRNPTFKSSKMDLFFTRCQAVPPYFLKTPE